MPDDSGDPTVFGPTEGGIAAAHPAVPGESFIVAPNQPGEFNRIRAALIPVACWRVDDVRFDFDSSFARPEMGVELEHLARLVKANPGAPVSVWGHADPVGNDDYNKALSGRRATIVYALMIANTTPATATQLWQRVASQESWGNNQFSTMRDFTNSADGAGGSALIKTYMQQLAGPNLQLAPADFLARGQDAGGKGDYQGCSEFNPLVLFSQADQDGFDQDTDKTARNLANAPNRRVLALLFRPKTQVDTQRWPCPRVTEGIAGCKKRFWSDGEARRSTLLPDRSRSFEETHDTFACRFYHRLTIGSPCERPRRLLTFRYCLQLTDDLPWSSDAKIRVTSEDGLQTMTFLVGDGALAADTRTFFFTNIIEGVRYQANVRDGVIQLELFPLTELFKLEDPDDPFSVVPLLQPNQFGDESDFAPSGISVPSDENDFAIFDGSPPE